MRALLDTHAVLWAAEGDVRLGTSAAELLRSLKTGEAVISDITLLEIAMLAKKGRIRLSVSANGGALWDGAGWLAGPGK